MCQQSHGRSYSSGARVFEDVLHFGAAAILAQAKQQAAAQAAQQQQPAAAGGDGGDVEMTDAPAAGAGKEQQQPEAAVADEAAAAKEAAAAGEYSEEQVAQLLAADPAALLASAAKEQPPKDEQPAAVAAAVEQPAAGQEAPAAAAPATPPSCAAGPPGSGLERVSVVDLTTVRSELDDGAEVEEGEGELEDAEDGTAGTAAAAGGEAEASRAEAAAQAARQWEALLHDSWQELQWEEEAALRAAGHEADAADEATNDEDADDVSSRGGVAGWLGRGCAGWGWLGGGWLGRAWPAGRAGLQRVCSKQGSHRACSQPTTANQPPGLSPPTPQEDFGARRTSSLVTGPSADYEEELWSRSRRGGGRGGRGGRGRAQRAFRRRAEEMEEEAAALLEEEGLRKRRRTRELWCWAACCRGSTLGHAASRLPQTNQLACLPLTDFRWPTPPPPPLAPHCRWRASAPHQR